MGQSKSKSVDKSVSDTSDNQNGSILCKDSISYLVAGFVPPKWKQYKLELINKNIGANQ